MIGYLHYIITSTLLELDNYVASYRIAGFFEGEIFHEFHESIAIRENFTLEIFPFQ